MPGPVGGGRSGGGGGGFSGGSHGSFSGGSHGSFSSGAHRSFTSNTHRPVGGFRNMHTDNNPNQNKKGCGIGIAVIIIMIALFGGGPMVWLADEVFTYLDSTPNVWDEFYEEIVSADSEDWEYDYYITPVEGNRIKLDESLCTPIDAWYEDRAGLFSYEYESETVEEALKYFYEQTGVQPYLITLDNINGDYDPDWDTVEYYLTERYTDLFGEDEGHYIFLYFTYNDSSYTLWYIPGLAAMGVTDENASTVLMDYIDMHYYETSSYAEMFERSFIRTAEDIMRVYVPASTVPASTLPAVLPDTDEAQTSPVVELTTYPEYTVSESTSAVPGHASESIEEIYDENTDCVTEDAWEENYFEVPDEEFIEYTEEEFIGADMFKYLAIGGSVVLAVILLIAFFLHEKKKIKELEKMSIRSDKKAVASACGSMLVSNCNAFTLPQKRCRQTVKRFSIILQLRKKPSA